MFTTGGAERSGMGFTIMESFMNSFSLRSVPGKGTTVRMRKKFAAGGPGVTAANLRPDPKRARPGDRGCAARWFRRTPA